MEDSVQVQKLNFASFFFFVLRWIFTPIFLFRFDCKSLRGSFFKGKRSNCFGSSGSIQ